MFLLVGGDSEIGAATKRFMKAQGLEVAATTRRPQRATADAPLLDLAHPLGDWAPPPDTRSACIFAAVARLADCHADPEEARRINVTQSLALADRLCAHGAYVLFLSTNQVFDGSLPHVAADAKTCPTSEYGKQKEDAEAALLARLEAGAPIGILRLAKVVSPEMPLLHSWVEALSVARPVRAFDDMTMAPVPTDVVAAAITALMRERASGIFQLSGPRDVSYAEVARYIARKIGADPSLVTTVSALSAGMPPGAVPRHTTLDSRTLAERCDIRAPDVWDVVDQVLRHCEHGKGINA